MAIAEAEKAEQEGSLEDLPEVFNSLLFSLMLQSHGSTTTTSTTNVFGAPVRDRTNVAVHDFGTLGAGKKRKAEGEAEPRESKKKREEK